MNNTTQHQCLTTTPRHISYPKTPTGQSTRNSHRGCVDLRTTRWPATPQPPYLERIGRDEANLEMLEVTCEICKEVTDIIYVNLSKHIGSNMKCVMAWIEYHEISGAKCKCHTLQGTNISHLGKRKIIFKSALVGDMLVPRRVYLWVGTPPSNCGQWRFIGIRDPKNVYNNPGADDCILGRGDNPRYTQKKGDKDFWDVGSITESCSLLRPCGTVGFDQPIHRKIGPRECYEAFSTGYVVK